MTADEYREIRASLQLNQGQLAEKLGVALNTLSRRELGRFPITREAELAVREVVGQGFRADVGQLRLFSSSTTKAGGRQYGTERRIECSLSNGRTTQSTGCMLLPSGLAINSTGRYR